MKEENGRRAWVRDVGGGIGVWEDHLFSVICKAKVTDSFYQRHEPHPLFALGIFFNRPYITQAASYQNIFRFR